MKILVTGGTGFVGRELLKRLVADGVDELLGTVRNPDIPVPPGLRIVPIADIGADFDWAPHLLSVDVVVHLAARVHVMRERSTNALSAFRRVNVDGTLALARQAASVGVRRFIFLSSIKVNGETTSDAGPFVADQPANPGDAYSVSKWEAEVGLRKIAAATNMQVVVIRPPLVYGPGVAANFKTMIRWLHRGVWLPLGAVTENRRSLVSVRNLVDLIVTCMRHPAAPGQTFLVSDGDDVSTAELLRRLGLALGKPPRLVSVPVALLRVGALLVWRKDTAERLLGSLCVDTTRTQELLGWKPPFPADLEMAATARYFLDVES
jgi:nucleoside-diphosphate-sugar epimerase